MEVFHDAPSNGDAVVGRGAAPQFVKQHQAALAEVVHDIGGFGHFDHKGTFAGRDVVRRSHAGEYFIDHPDPRTVGRNESTDLRQ